MYLLTLFPDPTTLCRRILPAANLTQFFTPSKFFAKNFEKSDECASRLTFVTPLILTHPPTWVGVGDF
jgi:hypothetical protein